MPRPVVPAAILAERGVPIPLLDGSTPSVVFTYRSLMLLEERFHSVQAAMEIIAKPDAAQFTAIAGILACGLSHANAGEEYSGMPLGESENLSMLLDPAELATYADAMATAFKRAFPQAAEQMTAVETGAGGVQDPPAPVAPLLPSPGASGTTSPASPSASPRPSSGT